MNKTLWIHPNWEEFFYEVADADKFILSDGLNIVTYESKKDAILDRWHYYKGV
jgi:hypothetical protein